MHEMNMTNSAGTLVRASLRGWLISMNKTVGIATATRAHTAAHHCQKALNKAAVPVSSSKPLSKMTALGGASDGCERSMCMQTTRAEQRHAPSGSLSLDCILCIYNSSVLAAHAVVVIMDMVAAAAPVVAIAGSSSIGISEDAHYPDERVCRHGKPRAAADDRVV